MSDYEHGYFGGMLKRAIKNQHLPILELLLKENPKLLQETDMAQEIYELAMQEGNLELAKTLKEVLKTKKQTKRADLSLSKNQINSVAVLKNNVDNKALIAQNKSNGLIRE